MANGLIYFVPVLGKAQVRFGTTQFIGCRRDRDTGKLVWDLETPTGIGEKDYRMYRREYGAAVRRGDLQQVSVVPLQSGGSLVTVLPGSPPRGAKTSHREAGESWIIGVSSQAAAQAVDASPRDGSESNESSGPKARR